MTGFVHCAEPVVAAIQGASESMHTPAPGMAQFGCGYRTTSNHVVMLGNVSDR